MIRLPWTNLLTLSGRAFVVGQVCNLPMRSDGGWRTCPTARSLAVWSALGLAALAAAPQSAAQVPQNQRERLAEVVDTARENLDPERIPELDEAREQLQQAYQAMVDHLEATADEDTRQGWQRYIDYQPLAEAMAEDAPVARQGRLAQSLYWRLVRNQPGLERAPLVAFREAAQRFVDAALFSDPERTVRTVSGQLEQVAELLRTMEDVPEAEQVARINRVLRFVQASDLAPQVVDVLQDSYGQPNTRVYVGRGLITDLINRPVVRSTPSDECILGVRVISQTQLNGAVRADLVPSEGTARLRLTLAAQFSSLGTGYAKPVRVRTRGYGNVTASRVLRIGDAGVEAEPVVADAALGSDILGIEHHLRIVRRIAARRAEQQKPASNRVAAGRLRDRVAKEFYQETTEQISGGDMLPGGEIQDVLRRLDLASPQRRWGSSHEYLRLAMVVRDQDQVTTAVAAPPAPVGHDLVVQVQESAIDNAATKLMADRRLTDSALRSFVEALLPAAAREPNAVREAAAVAQDAAESLGIVDPLTIHFAAVRPVIFEARDGQIRVGIRGTRFEQGSQVLEQALEITARYQPEPQSDGTVALVREGDVEVDFPRGPGRRLSIAQITLRQAVVEKVAEAFPPRLLDQPLSLPQRGGAAGETNRQREPLRSRRITATDGWLTLVFDSDDRPTPGGRVPGATLASTSP